MAAQEADFRQECYIDFRVYDEQRFQVFLRFFNALRTWTKQHVRIPSDKRKTVEVSPIDETAPSKSYQTEEDWLLVFRPQDLETLNLPQHPAAISALRQWHTLSRRERRTAIKQDDSLQALANFADMIKYFKNIDFELVDCQPINSDSARLRYVRFNTETEGKVVLEEVLIFFGFFSIIDSNC